MFPSWPSRDCIEKYGHYQTNARAPLSHVALLLFLRWDSQRNTQTIKLFCNDTLAKVMKNNNYFTQDKEYNVKFKITMMTNMYDIFLSWWYIIILTYTLLCYIILSKILLYMYNQLTYASIYTIHASYNLYIFMSTSD